VLIPLYAIDGVLLDKVLSIEAGHHISDQSFSLEANRRRFFLVIGVLGTAWTTYSLIEH